jgi:ATP-dependent DNA helicase DinG
MAQAVNNAISEGGVSLIEAGTGTGKTLAYLIPALAAGERVIVSTATKNLQEQLHKKDIPFLQKVIPRKFTAICMKGRSNYVCLYKLKMADSTPILQGLEDVDYFDEIKRWTETTETGDRAELTELPEDLSFWSQIDARAESCLGQKCPDFGQCFITRMRQQALESDVVIVNHHLFCADLALRGGDYGSVLPDYSTVVFDEAHELEDVAASYFGSSVSSFRTNELVQDASKLAITSPEEAGELTRALSRFAQRADAFWLTFRLGDYDDEPVDVGTDPFHHQRESYSNRARARNSTSNYQDGRYTLTASRFVRRDREGTQVPTAVGEAYIAMQNALDRVIAALNLVKDPPVELDNIVRRTQSMKFDLEFIVNLTDPTFVYWFERRGRGVFIHATPIDVSGILDERLFSNLRSAVLTSATLAAGGSFDFIRSRLGIREASELIIESHFDYKRQAILYLPNRMPDPRTREFGDACVEEIVGIIEATRGRAFVLFTSVSSMRDAYERVRPRIDYPVFLQGQGSKAGLLERFRKTEGAVLFATSSFWQGVDVQGEALSCVIISKLPFAVPSDPVVAARQRYIDSHGGNSFYDYSVPEAIIALKQGLGRLIRSVTDKGVLSILDPRLRTKGYGRLFLQSLPGCRITNRLEEAAAIFDETHVTAGHSD